MANASHREVMRFSTAMALTMALALSGLPANAQSRPGDIGSPNFGGPSSTAGQLSSDREAGVSGLNRWSDFKESLSRSAGLTFGGDVNLMGQSASAGPGQRNAAGTVVRIYGTWSPTDRAVSDAGALHFKIETRNRLGDEIPPQSLGPELGYAGLTSVGFSDAGLILTNLFWQKSFDNNRFAVVAGVVDVTDYLDVYGLVSPWTGFSNLAFSTNPTIPAPDQGLGLAARWRISDHFYALAGIADANGEPDDPIGSVENLLDTGETFKHVEVGWYDTWDTRYSDNMLVSAWEIDDRGAASVEGGWGLAASVSRTLAEKWTPFLRAGYADGGAALLSRSVSAGTGYSLFEGRDTLGVGLNWGRAPDSGENVADRDQYSAEAFYRFEPVPGIQITPDLQYIVNPAYAPDHDTIWVGGLRVRLVF